MTLKNILPLLILAANCGAAWAQTAANADAANEIADAAATTAEISGKRAFAVTDVVRPQSVSGIALSPNGHEIAFAKSQTTFMTDALRQQAEADGQPTTRLLKSATDLYVMPLEGGEPKQLTHDGASFAPAWSSDGTHIYYTSYASGKAQVHRLNTATGAAEQITDFALGVSAAKVSPNERYVAFVAKVYPEAGADGEANAALLERKTSGPIQAHVADQLLYRHWTEYDDGRFNHIILFDTRTKQYADLTPGAWHSPTFSPGGYDDAFAFSPDSREVCFVSNRTVHQEANTNADLWTVSVDGGEPKNITDANDAWDGSPLYSPDGRYIAYRRQAVESYESDCFRLALYDRKNGTHAVLTEDFDNWVASFQWSADGKSIYFLAPERGYQPLFRLSVKTKRTEKIVGDRAISAFEAAKNGTLAYTYSQTGKPSALYVADKTGERQLTHFNDAFEAEVDLRPAESAWVRGADGDSVEYFIVKPHNFNPAEKYPVVINVHGGPQMQWMDSYRADWQVYPGAGYVVVYPNPHGSTGYGQAFCRAISENWGTRPYEDVMRVTDAVEQLPYVDKDRIGAMGWSYGGYFMNWLQGQTKRYKCLASMMGLYDLPSMWGTTEELWFPNFELHGQPWNSDLYKRFSPSQYTQNFATPTLIITGERDYRVSYNQSLAYFTTLQTLGIPSRLIVFSNDGHWPSSTSMLVYYNAHLEWFHTYLDGEPAPWNTEKMVQNTQEY